jgi:hypothetical protein
MTFFFNNKKIGKTILDPPQIFDTELRMKHFIKDWIACYYYDKYKMIADEMLYAVRGVHADIVFEII